MKKLLIASGNRHKIAEINAMLQGLGVRVDDPKSLGINIPEPVEDGETFRANARIKALAYRGHYDGDIVADDSGIVVPLLGGEPGVHSARYAGPGASDEANRQLLIGRLKQRGVARTPGYFVCVLCLVGRDGSEHYFEAEWHGEVLAGEAGSNGFGYDPMFWVPQWGCTSAELAPAQKNSLSHRGQAIQKLQEHYK